MGRDIPVEAYFEAVCLHCQRVTTFVDVMGDDLCLTCKRINTNALAPSLTDKEEW